MGRVDASLRTRLVAALFAFDRLVGRPWHRRALGVGGASLLRLFQRQAFPRRCAVPALPGAAVLLVRETLVTTAFLLGAAEFGTPGRGLARPRTAGGTSG